MKWLFVHKSYIKLKHLTFKHTSIYFKQSEKKMKITDVSIVQTEIKKGSNISVQFTDKPHHCAFL